MNLPPLVIFPHKRISGVDRFKDGQPVHRKGYNIEGAPVCPADAWLWEHSTDAHVVAYHVPGEFEAHPRLNKRVLPQLVEMGHEPLLNWFIADVDNPGHEPWTDPNSAAGQIAQELEWKLLHKFSMNGQTDKLGRIIGLYLTKHGYRLVLPVMPGIPVSQAEEKLDNFLNFLYVRGIGCDAACTDWTRMFRMPFVVRDGVPQRYPARFAWLTTPPTTMS